MMVDCDVVAAAHSTQQHIAHTVGDMHQAQTRGRAEGRARGSTIIQLDAPAHPPWSGFCRVCNKLIPRYLHGTHPQRPTRIHYLYGKSNALRHSSGRVRNPLLHTAHGLLDLHAAMCGPACVCILAVATLAED